MIRSHAKSPRGPQRAGAALPPPEGGGARRDPAAPRSRPAQALPLGTGQGGPQRGGSRCGFTPKGPGPRRCSGQLRVPPALAPAGGRATAQCQAPAPSAPPAAAAPRGSPRRGRAWRGGGGSRRQPPTGPGCGPPRRQALPQCSLGSARGGRRRGGLQRARGGSGPQPCPGAPVGLLLLRLSLAPGLPQAVAVVGKPAPTRGRLT